MDRLPPPPTLQDASRALWLATLSLMTAFMQTQAPAHRLLMARRIARNFATLREQECFSADCRNRFARLGAHWQRIADRLQGTPPRWRVLLQRLGLT
ncbi:hypothetical protein [Ramlibacter algicola]|uniref:Uncharacterized protein n=1 Tax=Ramlibacter algicola TaxID=2795217 RepID=A0A934Q0C6_9BURK|nr:hypothetical protein [Ramlibacter algicola]MBK0392151.1 hypothetical protein [Ramlibacter algicola]